jgi:hypothetical protein
LRRKCGKARLEVITQRYNEKKVWKDSHLWAGKRWDGYLTQKAWVIT